MRRVKHPANASKKVQKRRGSMPKINARFPIIIGKGLIMLIKAYLIDAVGVNVLWGLCISVIKPL